MSGRAPARAMEAALTLWAVSLFTIELFAFVGAVGVVLAAAWQAKVTPGEPRPDLRQWWPLGAFLIAALLFPLLGGALPTGSGVARHLEWLLLPPAAYALRTTSADGRRRLATWVTAVAVASAVAAGLQHFGGWPPSESFQSLRWTRLPFDRVYEPAPGAPGRFLAGGLVLHRLKFSHVEAIAVAAMAAWALASQGRRRAALAGSAVFVTVAVTLFPGARAGMVAAVAGALAALACVRRPTRREALAAAGVVVLCAAAALAYTPVRRRLMSSFTERGSGARSELLAAGLRVVKEHPLTGIGLGRYKAGSFVAAGSPEYVAHHPGKAHNQFVSLAAEAGLPATLLFIVFLALLTRRLERARAAAAVGAVVVFVLLSLTHDPLFHPQFSLALILALASGVATLQERELRESAPEPESGPALAGPGLSNGTDGRSRRA